MDNSKSGAIYPMLPKENGEKVVIVTPQNGVGKVLIREDTILANLQGCAGCGRGPFACGSGVKKQWSALCWGKELKNNYYCCNDAEVKNTNIHPSVPYKLIETSSAVAVEVCSGSLQSAVGSLLPAVAHGRLPLYLSIIEHIDHIGHTRTLIMILSTTFVLSFIGTLFFCFSNPINDAILSNMVIRNNTLAYSIWQHPNVHPLMKVHIFNYTNWERVKSGEDKKLNVKEIGPYVYSQEMERVNIKFDGDRLSYQERNRFTYVPHKSTGTHVDQVTVPNLPLLGVVSLVQTAQWIPQSTVNFILNSQKSKTFFSGLFSFNINHPDPFVTLPLHSFLWGYDDGIYDGVKHLLRLQGKVTFDKFGLLVTKNGTVSEEFTINTGENDKDKMNIIEEVDGENHLNYWSSTECNSIDATDGSIFPPSQLDKHNTLHVYYPNLCRRLPFNYEGDIELSDGIQLLRYRMPKNVFSHPKKNPHNECYCDVNTGICPPEGVINVTACTNGVPLLVSFPHFYLGDEKLLQDITGMNPEGSRHDSYVDLHPTLGIALRGKSSLQINIQIHKSDDFTGLDFLPEGLILPIAWIEMSVEELPEGLRSLVYHGTYSTAAVQLGVTVICIITCLASGVCLMVTYVRRKRRPCVTLKKVKTLTTCTVPTASTMCTQPLTITMPTAPTVPPEPHTPSAPPTAPTAPPEPHTPSAPPTPSAPSFTAFTSPEETELTANSSKS